MHQHKLILTTLLCTLITSCTVGPDYIRPDAPVPTRFKEAKGKKVIAPKPAKGWQLAKPADDCNRGEWWKIFHDSKLNQLEDRLNVSNQSIITAYYNYRQARALVDEARANLFPTLNGSISANRQKLSSGGGTSSTFISTAPNGSTSTGSATSTGGLGGNASGNVFNTHSVLLNASWEPDIWGLVHRQIEAAASGAQASAALYAATRLSSQSSLAQYYYELRGLDGIQKMLDDTVTAYRRALTITKHQYTSGTVSRADIVQAQSQLENAQAAAVNNGILRGQYEHAIAVLIGVPPAQLSLAAHPITTRPPAIPLEIPSELLERRPDIAQAERLMQQANAQIGVAFAAYFPALTLTGSANISGRGLSQWFSLPTIGWAYGAQIADLIYDGGLRAATVQAAKEGYSSSVASYRQVVLTAFQDVEDNLVSLRILNEQAVIEAKAVASARLALKLVMNQYQSGTVAYSNVITAQISLFTAEQNALNVTYLRMTSAVGLIRSLGGGWDAASIAYAG